jgi:hypothetical protein
MKQSLQFTRNDAALQKEREQLNKIDPALLHHIWIETLNTSINLQHCTIAEEDSIPAGPAAHSGSLITNSPPQLPSLFSFLSFVYVNAHHCFYLLTFINVHHHFYLTTCINAHQLFY